VTYGIREKADYQATHIKEKTWGSEYEVRFRGDVLGKISLQVPGQHNVLNSLAAVAIGRELDMKFGDIRKALGGFKGIGRRLEVIQRGDVLIVDDYGHHPVEIVATLNALKSVSKKGRLWVLFQPHRYTRTKDLFEDFVKSFEQADELVLTNIYAASEEPIRGVTSESLAEAIREKTGRSVTFVPQVSQIAKTIRPRLQKDDAVLTLGAGDIWKAGRELAKELARGL
jgi:UDP-N-acetylmuramate--alanine ligase